MSGYYVPIPVQYDELYYSAAGWKCDFTAFWEGCRSIMFFDSRVERLRSMRSVAEQPGNWQRVSLPGICPFVSTHMAEAVDSKHTGAWALGE